VLSILHLVASKQECIPWHNDKQEVPLELPMYKKYSFFYTFSRSCWNANQSPQCSKVGYIYSTKLRELDQTNYACRIH